MPYVMTHLDSELREQLRDDLMKTIGSGLRDSLSKAMRIAMADALDDMVENQVFEAVDRMLERFLDNEEMRCWLSFDSEGPHVLIGIGPGECAAAFDLKLGKDHYNDTIRSQAELDDALEQLATMKTFIAEIEQRRHNIEQSCAMFEASKAGARQ